MYKRQVQNRLEHTINNLDNVVENTTSAESRIRDTDMAEEMVNYSTVSYTHLMCIRDSYNIDAMTKKAMELADAIMNQ